MESAYQRLPVLEYPGYYADTNGDIWSYGKGNKDWHKMSPTPDKDNRLTVSITAYVGKRITLRVHQLVALAFLGPVPDGMQVRHKDRNPSNNRPSNLEYGTPQDNSDDMIKHGTSPVGVRNPNCKLSDASVIEIHDRALAGESVKDLAYEYSVSIPLVYLIKKEKTRKHLWKKK